MEPAAGRPDYDQTLKLLLARAPEGVLALVAPDLRWRATRSPELPAVGRQADLVLEVEDQQGQRGLLHLELQTRVEPDLGERVADYGLRLWRRDHLPVRSVVVLLRETRQQVTSPFVMAWGDRVLQSYYFDVVRLWEAPPERVLERPDIALWPLASLMAGTTIESTVAVAEQIARASVSGAERGELSGLLWSLAGLRLPLDVVLQALRRNPMLRELLQDSSFVELIRDEGMQAGMQAGMRELAQVALEGRFGALGDDVVDALRTADDATLRAVVAHLVGDSPEQVRERLGLS